MEFSLVWKQRVSLDYRITICNQAPNVDMHMSLLDQWYAHIDACCQTGFRKVVPIYILCSCSLAIQIYIFCNESYWDSKIYFLEFEFYAVFVPILCIKWYQEDQPVYMLFSDF